MSSILNIGSFVRNESPSTSEMSLVTNLPETYGAKEEEGSLRHGAKIIDSLGNMGSIELGVYLPQGNSADTPPSQVDNRTTLHYLRMCLDQELVPDQIYVNVNSLQTGFSLDADRRLFEVGYQLSKVDRHPEITAWIESGMVQSERSPDVLKYPGAVLGRLGPNLVVLDVLNPEYNRHYEEQVRKLAANLNVRQVQLDDSSWGIVPQLSFDWMKKHPDGRSIQSAMTNGFERLIDIVHSEGKRISLSTNGRFSSNQAPVWKAGLGVYKLIDKGLDTLVVQAYRPDISSLKKLLDEVRSDIEANPASFKKLKEFGLTLGTYFRDTPLSESTRLGQLKLAKDFLNEVKLKYGVNISISLFPNRYVDYVSGRDIRPVPLSPR